MQNLSLQIEILWPAFLAGLLVLSTHVPLGREVLRRGIVFLDLAIAQMAAFGVVLAHLFFHGEHSSLYQTVIAITAALMGAMGLYRIRHLDIHVQEAVIGILFVLSATGSILLLSTDPQGGERLKTMLVGQILWLQVEELIPLALLYAVIAMSWCLFNKAWGSWLFYPLFAVTITLSTQFVGVYLVFASLIIPSLASLRHTHGLLKGLIIGVMGYLAGLFVSAWFDLPAGAAIVWCLTLVAVFYYAMVFCLRYFQLSTSEDVYE